MDVGLGVVAGVFDLVEWTIVYDREPDNRDVIERKSDPIWQIIILCSGCALGDLKRTTLSVQ